MAEFDSLSSASNQKINELEIKISEKNKSQRKNPKVGDEDSSYYNSPLKKMSSQ